ncbi:MAG: hypothetical protein WCA44_14240, partial [Acidobacteriaceae bacterium]
ARNIREGSAVTPSDWEVFASMLVDDLGSKLGSGLDLVNFEVKSAKANGAFEYQYHKRSGRAKLEKDSSAGHLFFSYFDHLRKVELRYLHGSQLSEFFDAWLEKFPKVYTQQRFRQSIPFRFVEQHGKLLMRLENGEVVYPALAGEDLMDNEDPEVDEDSETER